MHEGASSEPSVDGGGVVALQGGAQAETQYMQVCVDGARGGATGLPYWAQLHAPVHSHLKSGSRTKARAKEQSSWHILVTKTQLEGTSPQADNRVSSSSSSAENLEAVQGS